MKRLIPIIILLSVGYLSALAQIGGEVHITPDELSFEQKEGFDLISWKDNSHTTQKVGAPQLPVDVRTFVVPLNVKVTGVNVSVKQKQIRSRILSLRIETVVR